MMPPAPDAAQPTGTGSLPDANTAEAILYGKAYSWIKSALWAWDEMEDYLLKKADSLDSQIMDREWAYEVMTHNRYMIYARSPPVNEVQHLKDLFTLRSLSKCLAGIYKIREYREQNVCWARMKGIQEYVSSLAGRGISESEWKAATADYNMRPIDFDSVHGLVPDMLPGESVDWDRAMSDLMGEDEYQKMLGRLYGGFDVPSDDEDEDEDGLAPGEGPEGADEDEVDEESLGPFWDGLSDDLDEMFADPSEEAMAALGEEPDECSAAACWWDALDSDDGKVVDELIAYAEALA